MRLGAVNLGWDLLLGTQDMAYDFLAQLFCVSALSEGRAVHALLRQVLDHQLNKKEYLYEHHTLLTRERLNNNLVLRTLRYECLCKLSSGTWVTNRNTVSQSERRENGAPF
jgi:hypothetical protein